jgi:hypothetical protein
LQRFLALALAIFLVLTVEGMALGYGRFGATDLMDVPMSGTLSEGAFGIQGSFENGLSVFGMDLGIAPNLEFGVGALVGSGWQTVGIRLKYHLLTEKKDGFGLSIGAQDIGQSTFSPYVIAGKTLDAGLEGYLGIGGGWMDGILFGLAKQLPTGTLLFLEHDGHAFNLGGRLKLGGGVRLDLAAADMSQLVAGISYVSHF